MKTQNVNLPEIISGTDFEGIKFILPAEDIYNLLYANVKIQLRKSPGDPVAQEFKPGSGTLIIELPYTIWWPQQKITAKAGMYYWDLKIQFADQRVEIPFGGSLPVKNSITQL